MPAKEWVHRNGDNESYVLATAFDYADALLTALDRIAERLGDIDVSLSRIGDKLGALRS